MTGCCSGTLGGAFCPQRVNIAWSSAWAWAYSSWEEGDSGWEVEVGTPKGHGMGPLYTLPQQMEYLGRHIARKLNINYFDYLASSYRHVVRHWPLGASFNPGIVLRKKRIYNKPSSSQSDLDV